MGIDQGEMAQALNLTRAGRLAEATELIQRALRAAQAPSQASIASKPVRPTPASPSHRALQNPLSRLPGQNLGVLPHSAQPPGSLGTGQLLDRQYADGSSSRRYKIYLPTDFPSRGLPIIVMLHGGTQDAVDFAAGTGMNPLADFHHFLVVYPEQDDRANPMGYWNWFRPENQRTGVGEPALIAGITEQVISEYDADPDSVFIGGFSAGGAMATVMAATYPHLYAAAGVHSGLPYGAAHDLQSAFALMRGTSPLSRRNPELRMPLIIFHGDHDQIVNVANANHIRQQRHGVDEAPTAAGGQHVTRGQVPGGHAYTRTTFASEAQVLLEQWIVHQGGHAWFGGTPGCSYTDPLGPDASAEMVRFFSEHRRRQRR